MPFFLGTVLAPTFCIVCQRNKTASNRSGYEDVVKCVTSATAEALLEFSEKSDDHFVKAQFSGLSASDVICKEFHYHRSCQRNLVEKLRPLQ